MTTKTSYILVGVFVVALSVAFIWGTLWLSAGGPPRQYDYYLSYMTESVSGLTIDAPLRYRGVNVGKVKEIGLNPENPAEVRLLLQVRHGTPIKQDTVATLEFQGLTGIASVNLSGGTLQSLPMEPAEGEVYPEIPSRPSLFVRLDSELSAVLGNLSETAKNVNLLLDDKNRQTLSQVLINIEKVTGTLAAQSDRLDRVMDDVQQMLRNTRLASESLPDLMREFEQSTGSLGKMAEELGGAGETLRRVGTTLRQTVESSGADLERFTGTALPEATALAAELRYTAENLRRISETLERDPSVLLYGTPSPKPGPGE